MNAQMLPPEELGKRLKLARTAAGLTQDAAANAMTLARTTLTAIENGQRKVKPDELVAFAKLYKTSVSRLVSAEAVHVDLAAQFRRVEEGADLGPDERHAIDLLTRMATASVELERIAGTPLRQDYPSPLQLRAGAVPAQAEDAAAALRHRLGVGLGPIADFASVLEFELGVRVFMRPLPSKVSGVYAYDPAVGACMLINASHPRVRRRNSLAHECAHFVASRTHADVFSEEDEHYVALEERFAKRFATSLLMPAPTVRRRFEDIAAAEGGFKLRHLIILRHAFGKPERFNDPVSAAMHTNFLVVEPTLALRNLVALLDVQPYAAVMDQGQFHGLITRADVLNYLRRQMTATAAIDVYGTWLPGRPSDWRWGRGCSRCSTESDRVRSPGSRWRPSIVGRLLSSPSPQ